MAPITKPTVGSTNWQQPVWDAIDRVNALDGIESTIPGTPGAIGAQPADADLTTIAGLSPADDAVLQRKSGSWAARTLAQLKTDLGTTGAGAEVTRAADYGWATAASAATNDTAIAQAIAAARTSTRKVYLGRGDYQVSVPIDLRATTSDGSGVEFFGVSTQACRIINITDTSDLLRVGGFGHHLRDFTIRHQSDAPSSTTGDGVVFYKFAYSTMHRVKVDNTGRAFAIAQTDVQDPGTNSGASNWMFSCSFRDISVNRYSKNALFLNSYTGRSTGNLWENAYLQNAADDGTRLSSSGNPIDLFLCDESIFDQINIEDHAGTGTYILHNSGGWVVFNSLHLERTNLIGSGAQYLRAYGGAGFVVNALSVAYSDFMPAGSSGNSRIASAALGGKLDIRGISFNTCTRTRSGGRLTLVEGSNDAGNSIEFTGLISSGGSPTPDAVTDSTAAMGVKRAGDILNLGGKADRTELGAAPATTVALLGTSITDANKPFDQGGGALANTGAGYFHWAAALLRQSMRMVLEAGVSGDTTGGMLARVGDVITASPAICVVETGPNDVQGDSTFTNITTALTGIYTTLRNAGILVFATHIYPTTTIMAQPSRVALMHRVNRWITEQARTRTGVVSVPWAARIADPSTGAPITGALHDGIHPSTLGAARLGAALADAMEPYIPASDDLAYTNADPANLCTNGLMQGGTTTATGWTINATSSGTNSPSKVARADGDPGDWQQVAITAGGVEVLSPVTATGFTAGQIITADIELDGDLSAATKVEVQCWAVDGSGFPPGSSSVTLSLSDYYASTARVPMSRTVLRSYPLTIPSGTAGIRLMVAVAGPVTFRIARGTIRTVTP